MRTDQEVRDDPLPRPSSPAVAHPAQSGIVRDGGVDWLAVAREHAGARGFLRASMAMSHAIHTASQDRTLIRLLSTLEPQAMRYRFLAHAGVEALMDASIVGEMRRAVARSSYGSIVYEGYDVSCVLVDAAGRLVAQPGEDHPFHIIPVVWSVRALIERGIEIGEDTLDLRKDPCSGAPRASFP